MRILNLVRLVAIPIGLCAVLLSGGTAHADVAPNDGGAGAKDMSTMARPDMTMVTEDNGTGGCSVASHHATSSGAAMALVGAGLLAYLVSRRKQSA